MTTIFLRTLIIYVLLIAAMRLMGKRQIGELDVSELVTTLLISEIAALPLENPEIPLLYAVIPIITLLFVEILISVLMLLLPPVKILFTARPTVLVRNGVPIKEELWRVRMSMDELISALRQKDVSDIADVGYAILEPNGQLSVLKKKSCSPPECKDLGKSPTENGITHILVSEGRKNRYNLRHVPHAKKHLEEELKRHKCRVRDVFLMLCDDKNNLYTVLKKEAKP